MSPRPTTPQATATISSQAGLHIMWLSAVATLWAARKAWYLPANLVRAGGAVQSQALPDLHHGGDGSRAVQHQPDSDKDDVGSVAEEHAIMMAIVRWRQLMDTASTAPAGHPSAPDMRSPHPRTILVDASLADTSATAPLLPHPSATASPGAYQGRIRGGACDFSSPLHHTPGADRGDASGLVGVALVHMPPSATPSELTVNRKPVEAAGTYAPVAAAPAVRNRFCVSCGAAMDPDDRFCGSCGHQRIK